MRRIAPAQPLATARTAAHVARAFALAATALAVAAPAPSFAADRGAPAARFAAPQPLPGKAVEDGLSLEDEAQEQYVDALDALEDGQNAVGMQLLRAVAQRYPGTLAADKARRQLADFAAKSKDRELAVAPPDSGALAPRAPASAPAGVSAGAAIEPAAAVAQPPVKALAPRPLNAVALADRFRLDVGDRVFFAADSAEIGARARAALAAQAVWLKRWPDVAVSIEGHADESGSAEHNRRLSMERAEIVRQRLVAEGVDAGRISIAAHGRAERVATCPEPACAAQNRRVVTNVFVRSATGTARIGGLQPARAVEKGEPGGADAARK